MDCGCESVPDALRCRVAVKKSRRPTAPSVREIAPIIRPLLNPVVKPVLSRLDRHEELLRELKEALNIQFKRTAEIQAQLDQLIGALSKGRP